jgi:hypothetical protein
MEMGMRGTCKADSKGYFRFDKLWLREGDKYYLRCIAVGYVPRIPEYYFPNVKLPYFDEVYKPFTVDEGQIKHIKTNLEKGGSLSGQIFLKVPSGVSVFTDVTLFLLKKKKPTEYFLEDNVERFSVDSIHTDEEGKFKFIDLEPSDDTIMDEYVIELEKSGYHKMQLIKGITIKKGEGNYIDHTVTFLDPPELKGTVKMNGESPRGGYAQLYVLFPSDEDTNFVFSSSFDKSGNYFFYGIPTGKYELLIEVFSSPEKETIEKRIIDITKGHTLVLDFNLGVTE